jgi:gamma-glutamylcyclotransferase (GGCT)/AIG2-like uncharacterized protein YtfP
MPLLFSYGTLQQEDVQWSTFGRLLQGQPDELPGFEPSISVTRQHANVVFNGGADSRVAGTVFEITDVELAAADEYEQRAKYVRIAATLASGRQAWVYVDGSIALRHAARGCSGIADHTQLGYPTPQPSWSPFVADAVVVITPSWSPKFGRGRRRRRCMC